MLSCSVQKHTCTCTQYSMPLKKQSVAGSWLQRCHGDLLFILMLSSLFFTFLKDSSLSTVLVSLSFHFPLLTFLHPLFLASFGESEIGRNIPSTESEAHLCLEKEKHFFNTHTDAVIHTQKATVTMKNYKYFTTYTYSPSLSHTHTPKFFSTKFSFCEPDTKLVLTTY